MKKTLTFVPFVVAALMLGSPVMAESHMEHSMHDHGDMATSANEGAGTGTLHFVDEEGMSVNMTHSPIPELNWPQMTMDLPVTKRVDLSGFEADDKVKFTIKKGRDNQYRITEMSLDKGGMDEGMSEHDKH